MLNPDFRDMLSAFDAENVEYLIVGAYALAAHGIPRATGDLDFWIRRVAPNAERVLRALEVFGAPTSDLSVEDLLTPNLVFQIGVEPSRIDILTAIDGVEFDDAWPRRLTGRIGDVEVPTIGIQELIANKRAAGRKQDLADIEQLQRNAVHRSREPPN